MIPIHQLKSFPFVSGKKVCINRDTVYPVELNVYMNELGKLNHVSLKKTNTCEYKTFFF